MTMAGWRFLLLTLLVSSYSRRSTGWCTEEDKGRDCFINVRSPAPDAKQRGIKFLDAKDTVRAAIAYTPAKKALHLTLNPDSPFHQLYLQENKVGIGTSQPQCTLDIFEQNHAAELQLKGSTKQQQQDVYSAAVFLTDSASSKTWMMAHDAIKERRLSFGFLPSRNSNGQKKTVFALHSDAPSESLIVNEDGHAVFSRSYNRKQEASTLVLRRARGKPGNPQIVTTGDEVGKLSFKGFNGVQHSPLADISVRADGGAIKPGSIGSRFALRTQKYGDTEPSERLVFDGKGYGWVNAEGLEVKLGPAGVFRLEAEKARFDATAIFAESTELQGDVVMAQSATVHGKTSLSQTVVVEDGSVEIQGDLRCAGAVKTSGNFSVLDSLAVGGDFAALGQAKLNRLHVDGDVKVSGSVHLEGVNIGGDLTVEGYITTEKQGISLLQTVTAPAIVASGDQPSSFSAGVLVDEGMNVSGDVAFGRGLVRMEGRVEVESEEEDALQVLGGARFRKDLWVGQSIEANKGVTAQTIDVGSLARVEALEAGAVHVGQDLTVLGDIHVNKSARFEASLAVLQDAMFSQEVVVMGAVNVSKRSAFQEGIDVSGSVHVNGPPSSGNHSLMVHGDSLLKGSVEVANDLFVQGTAQLEGGIQLGDLLLASSTSGMVVKGKKEELLSVSTGIDAESIVSLQTNNTLSIAADKILLESRSTPATEEMAVTVSSGSFEVKNGDAALLLNTSTLALTLGQEVLQVAANSTKLQHALTAPEISTDHLCSLTNDYCVAIKESGIEFGSVGVSTENGSLLINASLETPSLHSGDISAGALATRGRAFFGERVGYLRSAKPFAPTVEVDSNFIEIVSPEANLSVDSLTLLPPLSMEATNVYITNRMNVSFEVATHPVAARLSPGRTLALVYQGQHWVQLSPTSLSNARLESISHLSLSQDIDLGPHSVSVEELYFRSHESDAHKVLSVLPNGTISPAENLLLSDGVLNVDKVGGFAAQGSIDMGGNLLSNVAIVNGTLDGITRLDVRSQFSVDLPVVEKSDRRLKTALRPLDSDASLAQVIQLQGQMFILKHDPQERPQLGLIAQEVEAVIPEAVVKDDESLGIRYTRLIPHLIEAVKALTQRVENLEAEVELLRGVQHSAE